MEKEKKIEQNREKPPEIELPEVLDREILTRQSTLWMRDNNILGKNDINYIILEAYMVSRAIKHVDLFIEKDKSIVCLVISLGRLSYLFKSRQKMIRKIEDVIVPILQGSHSLQIKIKLDRSQLII